jgi:integrase
VQSINGENPAEMRAKAILVLVSVYGLRRSEVFRLLVSDFDWKNMVFTVRRAKRGRVQQFPIGADLSDALLQYIRYARPQCSIPNLFVTLGIPYKPMNPSSVSLIVNLRMKRQQIRSPKMGPHSLRHACATRLLEKGQSLEEIADFLGHRGSRSVGIYAKVDMKTLHQVSELDPCGGL